MPRLPTALTRRARSVHSLLPLLLRPCRSLEHARNELRWLKEAASAATGAAPGRCGDLGEPVHPLSKGGRTRYSSAERLQAFAKDEHSILRDLCHQRGRGVPVQYLLGTEFFGDLELRVKRGVLIPRPETADAVIHLAEEYIHRLPHLSNTSTTSAHSTASNESTSRTAAEPLRILDMCCGSGCMGLLLAYELSKKAPDLPLRVLGVDISVKALSLAKQNVRRVIRDYLFMARHRFDFARADVLANHAHKDGAIPSLKQALKEKGEQWDVVLANPPYVSECDYFSAHTERSVRCFEPRSALVPEQRGVGVSDRGDRRACFGGDGNGELGLRREDLFYEPVLAISSSVKAEVVMMEVGSPQQARRVADMAEMGRSGDDRQDGEIEHDVQIKGNDRTVTRWTRHSVRSRQENNDPQRRGEARTSRLRASSNNAR